MRLCFTKNRFFVKTKMNYCAKIIKKHRGEIHMSPIYLDHASTSFPKAPGVAEAVADFLSGGAYNIGRGHYKGAEDVGMRILNVRRQLCTLFDFDSFRRVIFTNNITHSLNLVLKGLLKDQDHVLCTSMEHNAVMRPLRQLEAHGVSFTAVPCSEKGELDPELLEAAIRPSTKAVVMSCASNVCGTIMPIREVGEICHRRGLFYILDTAQLAGHVHISPADLNCDALCFTGHKALRGPQGIGGVLLSEELAGTIEPLISGGTGSFSNSEEVPSSLPDRFEAGTMNLPGIIGLGAALTFLEGRDHLKDFEQEMKWTEYFINGLADRLPEKSYRILGLEEFDHQAANASRVGVVSLDFPEKDNAEIAWDLESRYQIMTRTGLHCAPRAHETLGTYPQGTVRFSFGLTTTQSDLDTAFTALHELLSGSAV